MKIYVIECLVTNLFGETYNVTRRQFGHNANNAKSNLKISLKCNGYKNVFIKNMRILYSIG